MKQTLLAVFVLSVILLSTLLLLSNQKSTDLVIYSDILPKSRLLSSTEEPIVLDFYFNEKSSFYTDKTYLRQVSLESTQLKIPLQVERIEFQNEITFQKLGTLYHYQYSFRIPEMTSPDLHIQMDLATIRFQSVNLPPLIIPIGSIDIKRQTIVPPLGFTLSIYRPIPSKTSTCPTLDGVLLVIEVETSFVINSIRLGLHESHLNPWYIIPNEFITLFSGSFQPEIKLDSETTIYPGLIALYTPLPASPLNRFYLSMEYQIFEETIYWSIDDFVFYQLSFSGGCYERHLSKATTLSANS